jgi:hypothetical protein
LCFIDKEPVVNGVANLMAFRTMSEWREFLCASSKTNLKLL